MTENSSPAEHHDLVRLLKEVKAEYFHEDLEATIVWGRAPKRNRNRIRRSIVFGSWWEEQKRIRIHGALNQPWVPEEFLRFLIYHELCHAVAKPMPGTGRKRRVHHPEFNALENQYPEIERMKALSREIFARISKEEMEQSTPFPKKPLLAAVAFRLRKK